MLTETKAYAKRLGRALVAGNGSRVLVPRDRTPEGVRGGVEGRVAWGGADRHQNSPFHNARGQNRFSVPS